MSFCCETFEKATQLGTDNECYGRLLNWRYAEKCTKKVWSLGSIDEPPKYCPWCGTLLGEYKDELST